MVMQSELEIAVSDAEAAAFARRLGLAWLTPEHVQRLREQMETIARAGFAVPRQSSKFIQPAFIFPVPSRMAHSPQ